MILRSLSSRLIVTVTTILAVGFLLATVSVVRRQSRQYVDATHQQATFLASTIVQVIEHEVVGHSRKGIQDLIDRVGHLEDVVILRIFTDEGKVVISRNPGDVGQVITDVGYGVYQERRGSSLYRTTGGEPAFCKVEPILNLPACQRCHQGDSEIVGVMEICLTMESTYERIRSNRDFLLMTFSGTGALVALVIALLIAFLVNGPIGRLSRAMAKVESGDLSARVRARGKDELSVLGGSFDRMVGELESSRKTLEELHHEQLAKSERLASVGELAAGVAHEIKNPLAGIAGATQVLVTGFPEGHPHREIAKEVLRQTERLDRIIRDLLEYGRPHQGQPVLTDVNAVIERTIFFAGQHPKKGGISLYRNLATPMPTILIDPNELQQVLLNLIINAFEALKGKGDVHVASRFAQGEEFYRGYLEVMGLAEPKGPVPKVDFIEIVVRDTGPGLNPAHLREVFNPFFSKKEEGTGLGLSISKRIVTRYRGILYARNGTSGGAEFVVRLPLAGYGTVA